MQLSDKTLNEHLEFIQLSKPGTVLEEVQNKKVIAEISSYMAELVDQSDKNLDQVNNHQEIIISSNPTITVLDKVTDACGSNEETNVLELVDPSKKRTLRLNQIPSANKENMLLRKYVGKQQKHHTGKVKIEYIESDPDRIKTKSTRRPTLIKKV